MQLSIDRIRIDGGTQPRARIDEHLVSEYQQAMADGAEFPPVVVFQDGVENWLADGFHRFHAARRLEKETILADARSGTLRDAILYSVSANAAHGLRRTNEDKRRAVMTLLGDAEWEQWSDSEIARRCGVTHGFVGDVRRGFRTRSAQRGTSLASDASEKTYTTKHGTVATMKTAKIGRGHTGAVVKHTERIAELAKKGYRSEQIADETGLTAVTVRLYARNADIDLPDKVIGRSPRVDMRNVIEQTVLGLESAAASIRTLGVSVSGLDKSECADWAKAIGESMRTFAALRKKLQEHANGKD